MVDGFLADVDEAEFFRGDLKDTHEGFLIPVKYSLFDLKRQSFGPADQCIGLVYAAQNRSTTFSLEEVRGGIQVLLC